MCVPSDEQLARKLPEIVSPRSSNDVETQSDELVLPAMVTCGEPEQSSLGTNNSTAGIQSYMKLKADGKFTMTAVDWAFPRPVRTSTMTEASSGRAIS
jgi:hypothetical protein